MLVVALSAYALGVGRDEAKEPTVRSGIRGIVIYGSCVSGNLPPCVTNPVAATLIVRRVSDSRIASKFRSLSDGSFRIPLDPGSYTIESGPSDEVPGELTTAYRIVVPSDRFIHLRIIFRSSML